MISQIAVIGKNRALGKDNKLIWHLPGDLKRFKELTLGHPIIMGRKTFESIGRPLPGRTNIVITREEAYRPEGVLIANSLENALEVARKNKGNGEIFIIGGSQIFSQTLEKTDTLYLTVVDEEPEGDVFYPSYDKFTRVYSKEEAIENGHDVEYLKLGRA